MKRSDKIIKSMLGKDFFKELKKSHIFKLNSNVATSVDEIAVGLKIVPRTVMSFLVSNLSNLETNDNKDIDLPFAPECFLHISKKDSDVFSGYIYSKERHKKLNEFNHTSIPGIGLVLMSTFELYDLNEIKNAKTKESEIFDIEKLQEIIDERLRLHSLVARVVDKKIAQRDAVEVLIKERLQQLISEKKPTEPVVVLAESDKKTSSEKLKNFLKQSQQKKQEISIQKTEYIGCSDCGSVLYDNGKKMTLCICYGEDWNKEINIKKSENSIKMKFPKNIDPDNIQMLLNTLKNINKE